MAAHTRHDDGLSPENVLALAYSKAVPALYQLMRAEGRYRYREHAVRFRGPGNYLAWVKALDTELMTPVIVFGGGASWAQALRKASAGVQAGRWKTDPYPGRNWAT